mgnify:FL=1
MFIENGQSAPSDITVTHMTSLPLNITVTGRDYVFEIEGQGVKYLLRKDSVTEISLGDLGVGVHAYSCGIGCGGTITVLAQGDEATE